MKSIKTKLVLFFALLILSVTLIIGFIAIKIGYDAMKKESVNSLLLLSTEGAKIVESRMDALISSLTMISSRPEIENMGWEVDLSILKEELDKTDFIDIGYVLPNGYTYYSDGTVRLMSDRNYVKDALEGQSEISDVIISRITRKPEIEIAVPVILNNEVVGALVGRKEADSLSVLSKDIGYGKEGYAYMLNEDGIIIAHPDEEKVVIRYNPIKEAEKDSSLKSYGDSIRAILKNGFGSVEYHYGQNVYYAGYAPIGKTKWEFVITAGEEEVMAAIPKMIKIILFAMGIVFVISLGFVFLLDLRLTKPLIEMTKHSKRLGDLDIRENIDEVYRNQKDEIGTLSKTFHILTVNLKEIILELSSSANQVTDTAHMLMETSQQSAGASEDITRTMEEISKGAYEQVKSTENGLTQASVMNRKLEINNSHMRDLNNTTEEVVSLVNSGLVEIEHLITITNENELATKNICEVILAMKESSNQIGEASKIITDIARETNLLSFNASIEAARAGEAGKGFAVVAEEIKLMAEQSANSARYINDIVLGLQNSILNSVNSMNRMELTSKGQQESVSDVINKFQEIHQAMRKSESTVKELNGSANDMMSANKEITLMLQSLTSIAEQNAAGTQQTVSTMEEQTATVQIIADVSDRLTNLAGKLRLTISRFQV